MPQPGNHPMTIPRHSSDVLWEIDVQEQQIGLLLAGDFNRFATIFCREDIKTFVGKLGGGDLQEQRIIIHDQYLLMARRFLGRISDYWGCGLWRCGWSRRLAEDATEPTRVALLICVRFHLDLAGNWFHLAETESHLNSSVSI